MEEMWFNYIGGPLELARVFFFCLGTSKGLSIAMVKKQLNTKKLREQEVEKTINIPKFLNKYRN